MDNKQHLISVCIPVYDMHGVGHIFLKHSLDILRQQTFKDFEVVISDYSKTDLIKNLCAEYQQLLDLKYHRNLDPTGGMSANTNNAIKNATGKLIKIIFQDDFLYDEHSLAVIAEQFDLAKDHWLVTACEHSKDGKTFFRPFYPTYNDTIHLGKNSISSPSVLTIKNESPLLLFDTQLKWLMDCDYYKRCYDAYGSPKIVNTIAAVNRIGEHQITNTEANDAVRKKEYDYILEKYHEKVNGKVQLKNVTLVAVTGLDPTSSITALEQSMAGIDFDEVVLIAHDRPANLNPKITFKQCLATDLESQDPKNTTDYSKFIAYRLSDYITSDFALIVHKNAVVVRPEQWNNTFLEYDYIGAPWLKNIHFTNENVNVRVGNGGFSLRSKKLLNILNELNLPFTDNGTGYFNEDGIICVYYRKQLEDHGIKFAPVEVAAHFSREHDCEETVAKPFGFHDNRKAMPKLFFMKYALRKLLTKNQ